MTEKTAPKHNEVTVLRDDANAYCRILTLLGMEEEGDPVAEVESLLADIKVNAGAAPATDIDGMVNRFLGWKLPQNFYPDCYVSFDREKASQSPHGWPTGTNLLTAEQARKMFEYVMASTPCQVEFHTESAAHEKTTSTP